MLGLKTATDPSWIHQVELHLEEVLLDHAHCEKKAARTALNLICAYDDRGDPLCRELEQIVVEELEHFRLVLELLARRGIVYRRLKPSSYGKKLGELIRSREPERALDRLLVAGLIEGRSCERFAILKESLADAELADFYASLFESEAGHHAIYLQLAHGFVPAAEVVARFDWLAEKEAEIISRGEPLTRIHS